MRIYHGSEIIIEKPTFGAGKKYNDYGLGFYTTENYDLACEWAARPNNDGYVNCYDLDISALSVLDLNSKEFSILNWLAVLLRYRNFDKTSPLAQEGYEYLQKNF